MNNNPRNSLEQLEQFSDNTVLELSPQKTESDLGSKYVLIKHDYYSSDSDNGRELLSRFLSALCNTSYNSLIVYLIDKGTLLLDNGNPLYNEMVNFIERADSVIADSDSMDFYNVDSYKNPKVVMQPADSIVEDLIYIPDILILE